MIVTLVKAVHLVGIILWCAGLFALPVILAQHRLDDDQTRYARLRRLSHYSYTRLITPAAVIAVAAGTALIFLRGTFAPWFFAKMVGVGALVIVHTLIGNIVIEMGERSGDRPAPPPSPYLLAGLAAMVVILAFVLAKPAASIEMVPDWLTTPRNQPLPVEETPI
jgi:protoporphyrinogen IX oxidase